jgi:ATP-dependent Lhr-like helicase
MILIEKTIYNDRKYIIFHSLFGRRVNDALSRLFAFIFSDRINEEVGLVINDNGFGITLSKEFSDNEIKSIITEAINLDLKRVIEI